MGLTKITSRILDSSGVTILGTIATGVWAATDIAVLHGGTGASTAGAARTNLGLVIGTHVLAQRTFNDTNWDNAYTDRLKWDGGATGLTASTGRTSLGLGTVATTAASDYATAAQGTKADTAHGWGDHGSGGYVKTTTDQTIGGAKTFSSNLKVEKSLNGDPQLIFVTNPNSGTATEAVIYVGNAALGATSATTFMQTLGTGFSSTGGFIQDGSVIGTGTDISGGLSLMVRANADMRFYTNGHTNQRMIISSGGNVGIGTTSPAYLLTASGTNLPYIASVTASVQTVIASDETNSRAYIGTRTNHPIAFVVDGNEKMRITSGGEYSFGTPSSVTYGHGSNDGFHLRTGLELGFGNGNNNRPDFGINATGSGGGASLNIYCGEGSDDIDIQISPGAVMQFNSGGIKFGGTPSPAYDVAATTLDAYEKGSWTPVVNFGGTASSMAATYNNGKYTRVGDLVTLTAYIVIGTINGTGAATLTGLPFPNGSGYGNLTSATLPHLGGINLGSYYTLGVNAALASSTLAFIVTSATTTAGATHSNFSNSTTIMFNFTYKAS